MVLDLLVSNRFGLPYVLRRGPDDAETFLEVRLGTVALYGLVLAALCADAKGNDRSCISQETAIDCRVGISCRRDRRVWA